MCSCEDNKSSFQDSSKKSSFFLHFFRTPLISDLVSSPPIQWELRDGERLALPSQSFCRMPTLAETDANPLHSLARTAEFWTRAAGIYLSYKVLQARARALHLVGKDDATVKAELWEPHHRWAGNQLYSLCVDLRGFYLKVNRDDAPQSSRASASSLCNALAMLTADGRAQL